MTETMRVLLELAPKMTVIMMAFMLPALFILIGGPAVISIAEALG